MDEVPLANSFPAAAPRTVPAAVPAGPTDVPSKAPVALPTTVPIGVANSSINSPVADNPRLINFSSLTNFPTAFAPLAIVFPAFVTTSPTSLKMFPPACAFDTVISGKNGSSIPIFANCSKFL